MTKVHFTRRLLQSTILAGAAAAVLMPTSVQAQGEEAVEEVVVTGTRISRPDLAAPSPVTSVGAIDLNLSNTIHLESFLNTLPQAIPGFDGSSNNPGSGEASINLRGLGSARTLVLVDGRRYITSNQTFQVDLNTIPAGLVDRVDVVTGGASAVYGSDAVAGVINFVMKDDFEGLMIDSSYEITGSGDGGIFDVSFTVGGNFADGRGNAVLYGQYNRRQSVLQGDRAEAFFSLNDNGPENPLSETGSINIPSGFVVDFGGMNLTAAGVAPFDALNVGNECSTPGTTNRGGYCGTDTFGFIFNPNGPGVLPHINSGPDNTRYNYAPVNFLQLPGERYTLASFATYDVAENVEFYSRVIYTTSFVDQLLAPTPVFATLTINEDNPFVDAATFTALGGTTYCGDGVSFTGNCAPPLPGGVPGDADANGVPDVQLAIGRRMISLGGRVADNKNEAMQIAGGVRGKLGNGWDYDIFGSFNRGDFAAFQTGNVSISAYRACVRQNRCNIFEPDTETTGLDAAAAADISRIGAIIGFSEQWLLSASVAGEVEQIKLPSADLPLAFSAGVEYRDETLDTTPDSVLGPDVRGFNEAPAIGGNYNVFEAYLETQLPLVQGARFAEELTLNGAIRHSNYSGVGNTFTFAGGISWAPVSDFRLRGQFQRAVRAPNIGELFSPQTNGFPNISDPCGGGANGGFGSVSDPATVTANCIADGVPAAVVGTAFQVNAQIEGLFGGNPNLGVESGDTYTIGAVFTPSAVPGLSVTIDYYNIEITDAISTVPSQTIFDECYVEGDQNFCDQIDRKVAGPVDIFRSIQLNAAKLVAKGIDLVLDYNFEVGGYAFAVHILGNYTIESSFQPTASSAVLDCTGFYAPPCGEPTPEFKVNTALDWVYSDSLSLRVRWLWLDGVTDITGDATTLLIPNIGSRNYVDLSFMYNVNDAFDVYGGIRNVTGTNYVIIGDASAEQSNTYPATYETLGRQFFIGGTAKF
jgi:outer membrane receptor protein involved in Fe transport